MELAVILACRKDQLPHLRWMACVPLSQDIRGYGLSPDVALDEFRRSAVQFFRRWLAQTGGETVGMASVRLDELIVEDVMSS